MKAKINKQGFIEVEAENETEVQELENWCDENISEETSKLPIHFITEISYCYNVNQHNQKKCLKQCNTCRLKEPMYNEAKSNKRMTQIGQNGNTGEHYGN